MDVLLKEAEYRSTATTGKAGTETAASLATTIPNYRSVRQAWRKENTENTGSIPHQKYICNPAARLLH
jgi:hypothetical protein